MSKGQSDQDVMDVQRMVLRDIFPRLTAKQHEVLRFVAENRTSKEIAWELGISESAVNQRIEGVRLRAGSPPRAELARAYRMYLQERRREQSAQPHGPAQFPEPLQPPEPAQAPEPLQAPEPGQEATCNTLPDKIPQVPQTPAETPIERQDERIEPLSLSDAVNYTVTAPWQRQGFDTIVPEALDGANAGLNRIAVMVGIAVGLLMVAMAGLALVRGLSGLT
jgi:DNA-binding CsgD family transcriptional regulator